MPPTSPANPSFNHPSSAKPPPRLAAFVVCPAPPTYGTRQTRHRDVPLKISRGDGDPRRRHLPTSRYPIPPSTTRAILPTPSPPAQATIPCSRYPNSDNPDVPARVAAVSNSTTAATAITVSACPGPCAIRTTKREEQRAPTLRQSIPSRHRPAPSNPKRSSTRAKERPS